MSENINDKATENEDVEGHRMKHAPVDERRHQGEVEDVEGHRMKHAPVDERRHQGEVEDVEGHAMRQAPAEGLSDDGIDFERPR
jgi:hypothetical protein